MTCLWEMSFALDSIRAKNADIFDDINTKKALDDDIKAKMNAAIDSFKQAFAPTE